jgi:phosphopantetheinyl transferase
MGICYIKTVAPHAQLGIWRMTEPWQDLTTKINLPEEELHALTDITKDKRKQEWLSSRLLIQEITGQSPVVRHNADRKPYLPASEYQLSISHSGEYAAVYISPKSMVGVDIQQLKPSISKGIDYFLNPDEQQWIDTENNLLLHLMWSAKEAAFKYAGNADLDLRKHFTIKPFESNQNGEIQVLISNAGHIVPLTLGYDTFDDYVLTWTI